MPSDLFSILRTRAARVVLKTSIAIGTALCAFGPLAMQAHAASGPIVATTQGKVQGFIINGVSEFLGIPYAAPPIGNLRWRPPVAHSSWSGVRQATAYAPICAQITEFGVFAGPPNNNEDCLYLNVFTPNLNPSARLPVIVWIHGGGNIDGETPGYDGSKLAANGKTVVVTIAYRLNLMGWLAHPALDSEGHPFANYGLLDQQFVLKWVRQNIAEFGGDKNNVTIGGQSAGALDVGLNLVSPLAAGLFQRAICESYCPAPFGVRPSITLAAADALGVGFAAAAGCGSGTDVKTAKCLRSLTAAQIEALAGTASAASSYTATQGIIDGQIVPIQPFQAFINGTFNRVPVINGNTEDEQNFSLAQKEYFSGPPRAALTSAQYLSYVNTTYATPPYPKGTAAQVLAHYPLSAYATPQLAWVRAQTDPGNCGERALNKIMASQVPVYGYEFDDETAPFYFPKMPGFISLAYHTSDIQYLFPGWHGGPDGIPHNLNSKQQNLSDQLVAAWTNFAWTGNPNGLGNYPWPRYTAASTGPQWLIQDIPVLSTRTDRQLAVIHNCDFWEKVAPPRS